MDLHLCWTHSENADTSAKCDGTAGACKKPYTVILWQMAIVARAPKLLPVFLNDHPFLHCCINHSQHRICLQQHLPIIKAQYLQT